MVAQGMAWRYVKYAANDRVLARLDGESRQYTLTPDGFTVGRYGPISDFGHFALAYSKLRSV